jgi:hypothetical protein
VVYSSDADKRGWHFKHISFAKDGLVIGAHQYFKITVVTVRREKRRWISAGASPAPELVRSNAASIFQQPHLISIMIGESGGTRVKLTP